MDESESEDTGHTTATAVTHGDEANATILDIMDMMSEEEDRENEVRSTGQ